jgi:hypothetical protein
MNVMENTKQKVNAPLSTPPLSCHPHYNKLVSFEDTPMIYFRRQWTTTTREAFHISHPQQMKINNKREEKLFRDCESCAEYFKIPFANQ